MFAQAFSENVVDKPFTLEFEGSFSFVEAPTGFYHYGYIFIENNDPNNLITVNVTIVSDNIPGATATFCLGSMGVCGFVNWDVDIPAGESDNVYATLTLPAHFENPFSHGTFKMIFKINDYVEEVYHYFTSNEVDVLIIQDDGYAKNEAALVSALSETDLTFGIYRPAVGEFNATSISNIPNIIWNVTVEEPEFLTEDLFSLGMLVEEGANLLVMGQHVAKYLSEGDDAARAFLTNVLKAEFVTLPDGSPPSWAVYVMGQEDTFAEGLDFMLSNNATASAIRPISNSEILFYWNFLPPSPVSTPTKGVYTIPTMLGVGSTILLDFDFHGIPHAIYQTELIKRIFGWYGVVSENDETVPVQLQSRISAFPNPVKSELNIRFEPHTSLKSTETPVFSIFNIRGQKVYTGELVRSHDGFSRNIDLNNMTVSSGIYFIKVNTSEESVVQRVMVVK